MAITFTQFAQTDTTVSIFIDGLDPNYRSTEISVFLNNGIFPYDTYSSYGYSSRASITIEGLSPNTTYVCEIRAWKLDESTEEWLANPSVGENSTSGTIFTAGGDSGTWYYTQDYTIYNISSSNSPISRNYITTGAKEGTVIVLNGTQIGTITITGSGDSSLYSYLGNDSSHWRQCNRLTGEPYSYNSSSASRNFSYTYTYTSINEDCYLYIIKETDSVSVDLTIIFSSSSSPSSFCYDLESSITASTTETFKSISFNTNHGVIIPIIVSQAGTLLLYTKNTQTIVDDIGYLTTSENTPYTNIGEISSSYYLTYDDDHGYNLREFKIEYSVAPGTYYLFIKGYEQLAINTTLYVSISSSSDEGYVYIYTSSGWKKATPYIYTSSGWKNATPYIYTSSGWKKCIQ